MNTPFWIAHHPKAQRCRCVRLCGLDVCARCLGLYPLLFALIAAEMAVQAPGPLPREPWLIAALTVPALFDWARGRFDPHSGSNALRIATGLFLACALSRTIWFHMRQPFHLLACAHLAWLLLSALLIEFAAARHRQRALADAVRPEERALAALSAEALLSGCDLSCDLSDDERALVQGGRAAGAAQGQETSAAPPAPAGAARGAADAGGERT